MTERHILYISGSLGLGHVSRDLTIARELCRANPDVKIFWLAAEPAASVLRDAGEYLLPENSLYGSETSVAEASAHGQQLSLLSYLMQARGEWLRSIRAFSRIIKCYQFDLIVADEAYEVMTALIFRPGLVSAPFVMIYDFFGLDAMSGSPLEKLGTYAWNVVWSLDARVIARNGNRAIFIGELGDVPDQKLGALLPNRRQHAQQHYHFVGYILPFDPNAYIDRARVRSQLGYDDRPLVICSIGGTSVGKGLLDLCGQAYPLLRASLPDLHMVLVCGPRLAPESIRVPAGVEVRGYVPDLYEHLAACDLAVVQGGGTLTLELTALRRPFLYFPLEGHCEQEQVASRVARHGAGVRMTYSKTTPEALAEQMLASLGKTVGYPAIPTDGASKAAELISELLVPGSGETPQGRRQMALP